MKRWARAAARPLAHAAAAFGLGILAGAPGNEVFLIAGFGALFWATWRLVRRYRPTGRAAGYAVTVAAITAFGLMGMGSVNGDEDVMVTLLVTGGGLVALGSAAIKLRLRKPAGNRELSEAVG